MSKTFNHPDLKCGADVATANEYIMPDGNIVLAWCRKTAEEYYATNPQKQDDPKEESLFVDPP